MMRLSCPTNPAAPALVLGLSAEELAATIAIAALGFAASLVIATVLVVRLPSDYFLSDVRPLPLEGRPRWLRLAARAFENVLGVFLLLAGVVMSLPGVPGQGILTILLGLMLVDLPGKRRLEIAIVRRPMVLRTMNRVRRRFEKPPLKLPSAGDDDGVDSP